MLVPIYTDHENTQAPSAHLYRTADSFKPIDSKYTLESRLGKGSFSYVYQGRANYPLLRFQSEEELRRTKGTLLERTESYSDENVKNKRTGVVAVKRLTSFFNNTNSYWGTSEVIFIKSMPYHPNLVQIHELFVDKKDYRFTIVMEKMETCLHDVVLAREGDCFPGQLCKDILAAVLKALCHIHKHGFLHGDVKLENVLMTKYGDYYSTEPPADRHPEYAVKLGDYGLSNRAWGSSMSPVNGTRPYRAPELILGHTYYGPGVDMWAFGVLMLEVATLKRVIEWPDNEEEPEHEMVSLIKALGPPSHAKGYKHGYYHQAVQFIRDRNMGLPDSFDQCDSIEELIEDQDFKDAIRACLQWDPSNRATAEKLTGSAYFRGSKVIFD